MTKNKFVNKLSVVALALVASLVAALFSGAALTAFAGQAGHSDYFEANKDKVECIDEGATYFAMLDEAGEVAQMEAIVEVATAIETFEGKYLEDDYLAGDWKDVVKLFALCENSCRVKSSTDDNYYLNYAAFVDANKARINDYDAMVDAFETKAERFAKEVADAKAYLDQTGNDMLANTKLHEGAEVYEYRDMYDDEAQAEVAAIVDEGKGKLDTLTLSADYDASVEKVTETKLEYAEKLNNVDRNVMERAYSAIKDYDAVVNGEDVGLTLEEAKERADALVEDAYAFYNAALELHEDDPDDAEIKRVLNVYQPHKAALDRYTAVEKEHDFSDVEDKATIASEDGVITITAYVDGAEAKVFPYNVNPKIVDNTGSIYKVNAENEIVKKNRKVSVAYCFDITVYQGTKKWEQITEVDGKAVTYKVTIDLAKYYTECIENNETWLSKKLKKKGFDKNYVDLIKQAAGKYEFSLCYHYLGSSKVEGLTASVEGDKLVFETPSFSNFAVVKDGRRGIFKSPMFWLILLLVLILGFVAFIIVMSLIKYTITFETNGGSAVEPVKASYGEFFSMPKAPEKEGYVFGGWYEDEALTLRFVEYCLKQRKPITVYAKWIAVGEEAAEEAVEQAAEETVEEVTEEVVEEPVEEAVEAPTEEQLLDYFKEIRTFTKGFALAEENDAIDKDATIIRAFLKEECVELYLKADAEKIGAEVAEGPLAEETPAKFVIDSDEAFETAKAAVKTTLEELGLEETGLEVDLGESEAKSFGYKLKFEE